MKAAQCGLRNLLTKIIFFVAIAFILEVVSLYHSSDVPDILQPIIVDSTTQTDSVDAEISIKMHRDCKRRECKQSDLKGTVDHEPPTSNTNTSTFDLVTGNRSILATPTILKLRSSPGDPGSARSRTQGYLLALQYDQQLSGGFKSFSQLSKIASLLNLSTVEPYIHDTGIRGVPELVLRSQTPVHLTELYDVHDLQSTLKSCCALTRLVSFRNMLKNTSPHVIFVVVFYSMDSYFKMLFGRNPNTHKIVEVRLNYGAIHHNFYIFERWVSHVFRELKVKQPIKFDISRVVAVDARPLHPLHLSTITSELGSIIREEVEKYGPTTVVLDKWRGISSTGNSSFFYYVPEFSWDTNCGLHVHSIQHSEAVVKAARQFSQTLSGAGPVIGVHIRGERLLTESKGNVSYCTHCLQQLKELLQQLAISRNVTHESIHVFHDLGDYGSKSCTLKFCVEGRHSFVSQVKGLGFSIISYDPAFFDSVPVSSAFAAFVEREYLSHVDVLVTVGRGGFQQSIVERFKNNSNVHRICMPQTKVKI